MTKLQNTTVWDNTVTCWMDRSQCQNGCNKIDILCLFKISNTFKYTTAKLSFFNYWS